MVDPPRLDRAREVYRAEYRRVGEALCEPYPGIVDLLDRLREDGYTLATATSKGVEPTHRMLDSLGLTSRFDVIAAAEVIALDHEIDAAFAAIMRQLISYMMEDPRTISPALEIVIRLGAR